MKNTKTSLLSRLRFECEEFISIGAIALLLFFGARGLVQIQSNSLIGSVMSGTQWASANSNSQAGRIAERLMQRLSKRGISHNKDKLQRAVETRQSLLKKKTMVQITRGDGEIDLWNVSASESPLLVKPVFSNEEATFVLDTERVSQMLQDRIGELVAPVDARITATEDHNGLLRVVTDIVAKEGDIFDKDAALETVMQSLKDSKEETSIVVQRVPGKLINETGEDLGELTLLGTGRSNFKGSTWSRSQNVRKALDAHVNNVLVAPDAVFSFNQTLEGAVTTRNGWYMAKIIENGVDLVEAPGGGICQASTTTFRAMTNSGFIPIDRKAHSLYVSYYEAYGVGIDATIFPGSQDLTFKNDTKNHLVVQSYYDGYDAVVNIYGTNDNRKIKLTGPFFSDNAPDSITKEHGELASNEIAWLHSVEYPNGERKENIIFSRYRTMPRYLSQKYTMHASAGEES